MKKAQKILRSIIIFIQFHETSATEATFEGTLRFAASRKAKGLITFTNVEKQKLEIKITECEEFPLETIASEEEWDNVSTTTFGKCNFEVIRRGIFHLQRMLVKPYKHSVKAKYVGFFCPREDATLYFNHATTWQAKIELTKQTKYCASFSRAFDSKITLLIVDGKNIRAVMEEEGVVGTHNSASLTTTRNEISTGALLCIEDGSALVQLLQFSTSKKLEVPVAMHTRVDPTLFRFPPVITMLQPVSPFFYAGAPSVSEITFKDVHLDETFQSVELPNFYLKLSDRDERSLVITDLRFTKSLSSSTAVVQGNLVFPAETGESQLKLKCKLIVRQLGPDYMTLEGLTPAQVNSITWYYFPRAFERADKLLPNAKVKYPTTMTIDFTRYSHQPNKSTTKFKFTSSFVNQLLVIREMELPFKITINQAAQYSRRQPCMITLESLKRVYSWDARVALVIRAKYATSWSFLIAKDARLDYSRQRLVARLSCDWTPMHLIGVLGIYHDLELYKKIEAHIVPLVDLSEQRVAKNSRHVEMIIHTLDRTFSIEHWCMFKPEFETNQKLNFGQPKQPGYRSTPAVNARGVPLESTKFPKTEELKSLYRLNFKFVFSLLSSKISGKLTSAKVNNTELIVQPAVVDWRLKMMAAKMHDLLFLFSK